MTRALAEPRDPTRPGPHGAQRTGPARTLRPMPEGARAYRVTQDGRRIDARDVEWIDIPAWMLEEVNP